MDLIDKYIYEYSKDYIFDCTAGISERIFDVEINTIVFVSTAKNSCRALAKVVFEKGDLKYECVFCDTHNYKKTFFPVVINGQRLICFRKTLYGFTLLNAETLSVEFEYFPECVLEGEESFIMIDVKQLDNLLIFEGCYWAYPNECFVFDYEKKLFLNVSKMCEPFSLDKTILEDDELTLCCVDEDHSEKEITVSKQDLMVAIDKHGKTDF